MITWLKLEEQIKNTLKDSKVHKYQSVLEKDKNGWNWILNFQFLSTPNSLILATRFIFKLDDKKENLRSNDFLYLYDLNCKYRWTQFNDLANLDKKIKTILDQSTFGENIKSISEMMVAPNQAINRYFYQNNIEGYSIYDFNYLPNPIIVPCQDMELKFNFNVNNKDSVDLTIKKIEKEPFKISFIYLDNVDTIEMDSLSGLGDVIGSWIKDNMNK